MPVSLPTDSNFERSFADLAYARLKDRAKMLLPYLIGFQLVDKDDEGSHAVGVFGFKMGKQWIYAPMFFINGELKGYELLYLKDQDKFVPLDEEWVSYVLNRKPRQLGEEETTPRDRLGLRQPDFNIFVRSPLLGSKYAAARPTLRELMAVMPDYADFLASAFTTGPNDAKYACLADKFDLNFVLNALPKVAAYNLFKTFAQDEKFANAVFKFYDVNELTKLSATKKVSKIAAAYVENAGAKFCKDCLYSRTKSF